MREEETTLSFAEFGGSERLYPAPTSGTRLTNDNAPDASDRGRCGIPERETGIEPATLSLGS